MNRRWFIQRGLPAIGVTVATGGLAAAAIARDNYVEDLKECIKVKRDDEGEVSEIAFFESPNLGATEEYSTSHKGNHGAISMINSRSTEILIIGSATRIRRLK
jgi:hypothetical protein